jgi:hypothetical protein
MVEPKLKWVETPNENMKNLLLIVVAIASIANANELHPGKRYVIQPGARVATSVEALRQGKGTVDKKWDYDMVQGVKMKGLPPAIIAFTENEDGSGPIYYVESKYAPEKFGR